ncbi:exported protein of unknown function [Beijerinckiaceae bacterium RH AL1]|nr:exported protein of unknown function [Beijerinckiaceae bacterium RH AL8]VVB42653.1 exported protein of unknown function [Beijerinckiaceae bacterium RH CH11]VVC53426.1 exported protein of unknown function [Beijerinckiaceae bacterium RH AL1]
MSGPLLARALVVGGFAWLAATAPAAAQIHPMTSGSMWFYSPNHHSPFNQFAAPAQTKAPSVRPCAGHAAPVRPLKRPC